MDSARGIIKELLDPTLIMKERSKLTLIKQTNKQKYTRKLHVYAFSQLWYLTVLLLTAGDKEASDRRVIFELIVPL